MKLISLFTLSLLIFALSLNAQNLSAEEEKQLLTQTQKFYDSIDKMQVEELVELTYPGLYMKLGGKEKFTQQLEVMREHHLRKGGFKVIESSLGKPSDINIMGDEELVFISREVSIDVGESILNKQTYAIAIRKTKDQSWFFIDGDFFGPEPKAMFAMLTNLPKDTVLPLKKSSSVKKEDGK